MIKGLINSFSISKLVIIGEKIVKICQKTAQLAKRLRIWPPEGFAVKNNARNGFTAPKNHTVDIKMETFRQF